MKTTYTLTGPSGQTVVQYEATPEMQKEIAALARREKVRQVDIVLRAVLLFTGHPDWRTAKAN